MDAQMVLSTARSGRMPDHWHAWPLRKEFVLRSAIKWGIGGLVLMAVFVFIVSATVPTNFEHASTGVVLFTIIILTLAGLAAFGGVGIAVYDLWRASNAGRYLLVMTPEDYVKEEPRKITHVPMENIAHVTLRGVKSADMIAYEETAAQQGAMDPGAQPIGGALLSSGPLMIGAQRRRTRSQTPTLAFLDTRTNKEVIVGTDASFDELAALEYVLKLEIYENERRHRART